MIKLTSIHGNFIHVNPAAIDYMIQAEVSEMLSYPTKKEPKRLRDLEYTVVVMRNRHQFKVSETPEVISEGIYYDNKINA